MFLVITRNFPPEVGGMQILMGGLTKSLIEILILPVSGMLCVQNKRNWKKTSTVQTDARNYVEWEKSRFFAQLWSCIPINTPI